MFWKRSTDHEEVVDLVVLDGLQEGIHLELGQHNGLITPVSTGVTGGHQPKDVALGQKTQRNFGIELAPLRSDRLPPGPFEGLGLQGVGHDIPVGDHYTFLQAKRSAVHFSRILSRHGTYRQTRSATGVAKEGSTTTRLSREPVQLFDLRQRPTLFLDLRQRLVCRRTLGIPDHLRRQRIDQVDALFGEIGQVSGLQSRSQQRNTGEQGLGLGISQLIPQLGAGVGGVGGGDETAQLVSSPRQGDRVDL